MNIPLDLLLETIDYLEGEVIVPASLVSRLRECLQPQEVPSRGGTVGRSMESASRCSASANSGLLGCTRPLGHAGEHEWSRIVPL